MGDARQTGVFDLGENPELEDLFQAQKRASELSIRTSTIARVVASDAQPLGFDSLTGLCSLMVQQPQVIKNRNLPLVPITLPPVIIKNIPVYFPKGASATGEHYISFPISIGTTGELIIQDRDPSKWLLSGSPVDPVNRMTHNLAFGVFHPGLSPVAERIQGFDINATVIEGPQIKIGANATEPAVLGTKLLAKMDELIAIFNSHTHIVAGTCPPGGGPLTGGTAAPTTEQQQPTTPTLVSSFVKVK